MKILERLFLRYDICRGTFIWCIIPCLVSSTQRDSNCRASTGSQGTYLGLWMIHHSYRRQTAQANSGTSFSLLNKRKNWEPEIRRKTHIIAMTSRETFHIIPAAQAVEECALPLRLWVCEPGIASPVPCAHAVVSSWVSSVIIFLFRCHSLECFLVPICPVADSDADDRPALSWSMPRVLDSILACTASWESGKNT